MKEFNKIIDEEIKQEVIIKEELKQEAIKLIKKYNFNSIKEMCEYAKKNNLIITKSLTEEEKNNMNELSKFLEGIVIK